MSESVNGMKALMASNTEIKAQNEKLNKTVKELNDLKEEEASEDDLIDLFNLYEEVSSLIKNREILVERPEIVFV